MTFKLISNEGANALLDMTPEEAQQFARLAAVTIENTGNLSRGMREALAAHVSQRNEYARSPDHYDITLATFTTQINDVGECLAAQLVELGRDFTPDRADRMCIALQGVMDAIRRMAREAGR